MSDVEKQSTSSAETLRIARSLAAEQPDCPAYYLQGELGAGKTLFAKGIADCFGIDPALVVSPTFTLVNRYSGGRRTIYHLDLYRIEDEHELIELGIEEMEEEGALILVEWAEKLGSRHRQSNATTVVLQHSEKGRRILILRGEGDKVAGGMP